MFLDVLISLIIVAVFIAFIIYLIAVAVDRESWLIGILAAFIFCAGLAYVITGLEEQKQTERTACESIGGKYAVVDTTTTFIMVNNVMLPQEIDEYGCVK